MEFNIFDQLSRLIKKEPSTTEVKREVFSTLKETLAQFFGIGERPSTLMETLKGIGKGAAEYLIKPTKFYEEKIAKPITEKIEKERMERGLPPPSTAAYFPIELGKTITGRIPELGLDIVRTMFPRFSMKIAQEIGKKVVPPEKRERVEHYVPETIPEKILYGEEPVEPFTTTAEKGRKWLEEKLGIQLPKATAYPMAFGLAALESPIFGVGKGIGKKTLESLAKETTEEGVKRILRGKLAKEIIEDVAPKIAKETNPEEIGRILTESVGRLVKPEIKAIPKELEPLAEQARLVETPEELRDIIVSSGKATEMAKNLKSAGFKNLEEFWNIVKGVKEVKPEAARVIEKAVPEEDIAKREIEKLIKPPTEITPPTPPKLPEVPAELPDDAKSGTTKIIDFIKKSKSKQREIQRLYTQERAARIKAIEELRKTEPPSVERYLKELRILKGPLTTSEAKTLPFEGLTDNELKGLLEAIVKSPNLDAWQKISAQKAIIDILYGGRTPQALRKFEQNYLKKVFGEDFVKTLIETDKSFWTTARDLLVQGTTLPRTLMATGDVSAPFRQGLFLISHPKEFFGNIPRMIKGAFSERYYQEAMRAITEHPLFEYAREGGLSLTELEGPLTELEERFIAANLGEKIPLAGRIIRGSNRAYTLYLNKLRYDIFTNLFKNAKELGLNPETDERLLKSITEVINVSTGRGSLPQWARGSGQLLSNVFFAPRLMASRISLLNPKWYVDLHPFARKEALKNFFTVLGTGLTILGLAKAGGADVGTDPRSADFGKIRVGNTRIDIWGGLQQYVRSAAQLITGTYISSVTGVPRFAGEGYPPFTRADIALRFFEQKEAPFLSFIHEALRGETGFGEDFDFWKALKDRMIPMAWQDIYDLAKEDPSKIPIGLLSLFGVGVQSYKPTLNDDEKKLAEAFKLAGAREEDINKLIIASRRINALEARFREVVAQLNDGKITPQEALERARKIDEIAKKNVPSALIPYLEAEEGLKERGGYLTIRARAEIERLRSLPLEERTFEWNLLQRTDPNLVKKIMSILKEEQREQPVETATGLPVDFLKSLPLDQRIYIVYDYVSKLPLEQRTIVWEALKRAGVITRNFEQRMRELFAQSR